MKRLLFTLVATFLFCFTGITQKRLLIPYHQNNKWGYCDTNGVIKIKPIYDSVTIVQYPCTKAYKNHKESIIDFDGKILLPFSDSVNNIGCVYLVKNDGKFSFYNKDYKQLFSMTFDAWYSTYWYDVYKADIDNSVCNNIIVKKDSNYYLLSLKTLEMTPIPKLVKRVIPEDDDNEFIVSGVIDDRKKPKYDSKNFNKITKQYDTIYYAYELNTYNVSFKIFAITKRGKLGYVGENGVEYFKLRGRTKHLPIRKETAKKAAVIKQVKKVDCPFSNIELIDSCLIGRTIAEAIKFLQIDTTQYIPMLEGGRAVNGIYIRTGVVKINLIIEHPLIMSNEQATETFKHYSSYILDEKIVGLCWHSARVSKIIGNMRYFSCWDY